MAHRRLGRPSLGHQPLEGDLGARAIEGVVAVHQERRDLLRGEALWIAPEQGRRTLGRALAAQPRVEVGHQHVVRLHRLPAAGLQAPPIRLSTSEGAV